MDVDIENTRRELGNKKVFMDIMYTPRNASGSKTARILAKLFVNETPMTCHNFLSFVRGVEKEGKTYSYKNNTFHRIIADFMIQGGDVTTGDGRGGFSVYGRHFRDENFKARHSRPGVLSMANAGPNTNGSQFFITVAKTPWLDGRHVVFGEIEPDSMETAYEISRVETVQNDAPKHPVKIVDCGLI